LNLGGCGRQGRVNELLRRRDNYLLLIFLACGVGNVLANDKQERGYK
jgi:hypothetical protein